MSFPSDFYERDLNPPEGDAATRERCSFCDALFWEQDSDAEHKEFCSSECEYESDHQVSPADEPDEAYERAAARARSNDFEDTGGKDWT